jgi:hypothetical protein
MTRKGARKLVPEASPTQALQATLRRRMREWPNVGDPEKLASDLGKLFKSVLAVPVKAIP